MNHWKDKKGTNNFLDFLHVDIKIVILLFKRWHFYKLRNNKIQEEHEGCN